MTTWHHTVTATFGASIVVLPMVKDCGSLHLSFDILGSQETQISCFPCSTLLYSTQSQKPDSMVVGPSQRFLSAEYVNDCTGQRRSGEVDVCLLQAEVVKIHISFIHINSAFSSFI